MLYITKTAVSKLWLWHFWHSADVSESTLVIWVILNPFLGLLFAAFACEAKKHLFLPSDPGSLKQTLGRYRTRSKQVTFFFLSFSFFFTTADGLTEIAGASRVTTADRSLQAVAHTTWTACSCTLVCMCVYEHAWFCCTWSAAIKAYYQSKNIIKVCILNKWFY